MGTFFNRINFWKYSVNSFILVVNERNETQTVTAIENVNKNKFTCESVFARVYAMEEEEDTLMKNKSINLNLKSVRALQANRRLFFVLFCLA